MTNTPPTHHTPAGQAIDAMNKALEFFLAGDSPDDDAICETLQGAITSLEKARAGVTPLSRDEIANILSGAVGAAGGDVGFSHRHGIARKHIAGVRQLRTHPCKSMRRALGLRLVTARADSGATA